MCACQESSYSALIRCCCLNGLPDKALELFQSMKEEGLLPKLRTISQLLSSLSAAAVAAASNSGSGAIDVVDGVGVDRGAQLLALFAEMSEVHGIDPTEKEYLSVLR